MHQNIHASGRWMLGALEHKRSLIQLYTHSQMRWNDITASRHRSLALTLIVARFALESQKSLQCWPLVSHCQDLEASTSWEALRILSYKSVMQSASKWCCGCWQWLPCQTNPHPPLQWRLVRPMYKVRSLALCCPAQYGSVADRKAHLLNAQELVWSYL